MVVPGADHPLRVAAQAAIPRDLSSNAPETVIQAVRNRSISSSVVVGPRLTRTAARAKAGATPIALSTCEGCTLPDEQAAPDDTATPARSNRMMAVSAFRASRPNSVVLGNRSA